jgi:hypothetical protein
MSCERAIRDSANRKEVQVIKLIFVFVLLISNFVQAASPYPYAGCDGQGDIYTGKVSLDIGPLGENVFSMKLGGLLLYTLGNTLGTSELIGLDGDDPSKRIYRMKLIASTARYSSRLDQRGIELPSFSGFEDYSGTFIFDEKENKIRLTLFQDGEVISEIALTCFSSG